LCPTGIPSPASDTPAKVARRTRGAARPGGRLGLGARAAQFGFQQVHGLGEGLLLAGGELGENAGERARGAVEPCIDQGSLDADDGRDGAPSVGGIGTALDQSGAVQVGEHAADSGQREAKPGGKLADGERFAAKLLERGDDSAMTLGAEVPVDRADYGLTFNQLGMMSMKSAITIHAVFTRQ